MKESVSKNLKYIQSHYTQAFDYLEKELDLKLSEQTRSAIKVVIIKTIQEYDLLMEDVGDKLKESIGDDYMITTDPEGNQEIKKKEDV